MTSLMLTTAPDVLFDGVFFYLTSMHDITRLFIAGNEKLVARMGQRLRYIECAPEDINSVRFALLHYFLKNTLLSKPTLVALACTGARILPQLGSASSEIIRLPSFLDHSLFSNLKSLKLDASQISQFWKGSNTYHDHPYNISPEARIWTAEEAVSLSDVFGHNLFNSHNLPSISELFVINSTAKYISSMHVATDTLINIELDLNCMSATFPNVKKLDLELSYIPTRFQFDSFAHLEDLTITPSRKVRTYDGISFVLPQSIKSFKTRSPLELNLFKISGKKDYIDELPNLHLLDVRSIFIQQRPGAVDFLPDVCKYLRTLHLSHRRSFIEFGTNEVGFGVKLNTIFQRCSLLEHFSMDVANRRTTIDLDFVISNSPNLHTLEVRGEFVTWINASNDHENPISSKLTDRVSKFDVVDNEESYYDYRKLSIAFFNMCGHVTSTRDEKQACLLSFQKMISSRARKINVDLCKRTEDHAFYMRKPDDQFRASYRLNSNTATAAADEKKKMMNVEITSFDAGANSDIWHNTHIKLNDVDYHDLTAFVDSVASKTPAAAVSDAAITVYHRLNMENPEWFNKIFSSFSSVKSVAIHYDSSLFPPTSHYTTFLLFPLTFEWPSRLTSIELWGPFCIELSLLPKTLRSLCLRDRLEFVNNRFPLWGPVHFPHLKELHVARFSDLDVVSAPALEIFELFVHKTFVDPKDYKSALAWIPTTLKSLVIDMDEPSNARMDAFCTALHEYRSDFGCSRERGGLSVFLYSRDLFEAYSRIGAAKIMGSFFRGSNIVGCFSINRELMVSKLLNYANGSNMQVHLCPLSPPSPFELNAYTQTLFNPDHHPPKWWSQVSYADIQKQPPNTADGDRPNFYRNLKLFAGITLSVVAGVLTHASF